jgi:cytochrome b involved in lipid metabolism
VPLLQSVSVYLSSLIKASGNGNHETKERIGSDFSTFLSTSCTELHQQHHQEPRSDSKKEKEEDSKEVR